MGLCEVVPCSIAFMSEEKVSGHTDCRTKEVAKVRVLVVEIDDGDDGDGDGDEHATHTHEVGPVSG